MSTRAADSPPAPRLVSGKLAILVIVGLGLILGVVSWFYYAGLQRRPLECWGVETARLIARAPQVEALRLTSVDSATSQVELITLNDEKFTIAARRDVGQARGFSHLRQGLLHDVSIAWEQAPPENIPWRYALRFRDGERSATICFSADALWVVAVDGKAPVSLAPVAPEFASFFEETLAEK